MNPRHRTLTGRFYYTLWLKNAAGYSNKFLTCIQEAVDASAFPEILLERATLHTGGCYLPFIDKQFDFGTDKVQSFDGYIFHSLREDLAQQRCIYKATEFGNILHVSILFYNEIPNLGCRERINQPIGCLPKKQGLLEQEYVEVFERIVWMIIEEAAKRLDEEPLHIEKSDRDTPKKSSGLGSLLEKLPI